MKILHITTLPRAFFLATGLALLLEQTACQSLNPITKTPGTVTSTVVQVPASTNSVTQGTNVTVTITPATTVTNFTTNWVYSVNPSYTQAIQTAKDVNSTANPTPTAPIINIALGLLAAGLGWYANRKNNQKNATQDLLTTVIKGVEAAPAPEAVKQSIAATAQARDLSKEMNAAVQAVVPETPVSHPASPISKT